MRLAIVPMKPLAGAKARLAPALSPAERRALALAMLADVVEAATVLDEVWVLNSDGDAAAVAAAAGAKARPDPAPGAGLNASLEAATADAVDAGASGVLVLSSDLPLVTTDDVLAVAHGEGVAIGPSSDGAGTNALWRSPPGSIPPAFGPDSRAIHERLARERGVSVRVVEHAGLGLDVDAPEDLRRAWDVGPRPHTRRALEEMRFRERGSP